MLDSLTSDYAAIYTIPAIAGSFFFILRLVLMLIGAGMGEEFGDGAMDDGGLDHAGGLDHGEGAGTHDHHASDSTSAFKVLSLQTIAGFVMGFGWGGLGALRGLGWEPTMSFVAAVVCGVFIVWLLTTLLKSISLLHASGNVPIDAAVGCSGAVYTGVPAKGAGRGKVRLIVNNRARIFNAVSAGEELPRHTRVRVVMVNRDNTVTVAPDEG